MSDPQGQGQPPPPTPPPTGQGQPPPPPPPTGGADLDKLNQLNQWAQSFGAREKAEGRASVERDVAEKLGMTLDEAAAFVKEQKDRAAAALPEAEQKLLKSEEARQEAQRVRQEAYGIIRDALATDALMDLGMPRQVAKQYAPMVQFQFTSGMDDGARVAAVVAGAEQFKSVYPQMFVAVGGNGRGPTDTATRGGQPPTSQGGESSKDRANARLRERLGRRLSTDPVPAHAEIDGTRRSV